MSDNLNPKSFDEDKLNRTDFADNLLKAIEADYEFFEGSYVLSLNAPFGEGKTTFLNMWRESLTKHRYSTAYVNAWEHDYIDEPLFPILSALIERTEQSKEGQAINDNLKQAFGVTVSSINQVTKHLTGLDFKESTSEAKREISKAKGKEVFKDFEKLKKCLESLRSALKELKDKCTKKPLFIFVDELDRAKPDYCVKFLERIKHLFNIQGIVFVLAVHKEQLRSSMKAVYGEGLDFEGYFRRFITQEARLPKPSSREINKYIDHVYSTTFLRSSPGDAVSYLQTLSSQFGFSLRDIQYCLRILKRFLREDKSARESSWHQLVVLMTTLSIYNERLYHLLGKSEINLEISEQLVKELKCFDLQNGTQSEFLRLILFDLEKNLPPEEKLLVDTIWLQLFPGQNKQQLDLLKNNPHFYGHSGRYISLVLIYKRLETWREISDSV